MENDQIVSVKIKKILKLEGRIFYPQNFLKMKFKLSMLFLLFLISCKNEKSIKSEEIKIEQVNAITKLSDSIYLSDVRSLISSGNYLYFSDYSKGQVFKVEKENLELIRTIGNQGDGPGEFRGAANLFFRKEKLYIQNDFKRTIELYNDSLYLKTIKIPNEIADIKFHNDFLATDEEIYLSHSESLSPILVMDESGVKNRGGRIFDFKNSDKNRSRNNRSFYSFGKLIFAVSDNIPSIDIYNLDLSFINTIDISSFPIMKENLNYINTQKEDNNSYYTLIKDGYIFRDKLFLLMNTYEPYRSNKIIMLRIYDDDIKFMSTIKLDENSLYSAIAVDEEFLFAFNSRNSSLEKYKFK